MQAFDPEVRPNSNVGTCVVSNQDSSVAPQALQNA